ncbi:MAG TPA: hypothetical protein VGH64_09350 [Puia sp.]|jgi:drug/metabolite transporter (DMT)-like permease
MRTFGIVLIILGIVMIIIKGISVPVQKNVVDVGPVKIDKTENKWIGWPTYAGVALAVIGTVLVVSNKGNR